MRRFLPLLAVVALLAGCGGDDSGGGSEPGTLALDFQPNAVHAGIYSSGLKIRVPAASTDSLKLMPSSHSGTRRASRCGSAAWGRASSASTTTERRAIPSWCSS